MEQTIPSFGDAIRLGSSLTRVLKGRGLWWFHFSSTVCGACVVGTALIAVGEPLTRSSQGYIHQPDLEALVAGYWPWMRGRVACPHCPEHGLLSVTLALSHLFESHDYSREQCAKQADVWEAQLVESPSIPVAPPTAVLYGE